jgi:perosamine synthetase
MRLHQRHHIDIGWDDLASALLSAGSRSAAAALADIRRLWPDDVDVVACLSVRTAFDSLLNVLALPQGSEIVMSAINIAGMAEIASAHGLVMRAVDIDPDRLSPSPDAMAGAINEKTRLVLIAHLFGSRTDLAAYAPLRSERVLLIEDCAQAWTPDFRGSPEADVSLFSFGPIKTATALGGAVVVLRDPKLAAALERDIAAHPLLPRRWFVNRILKYALLKAVSRPLPYGLFSRALAVFGGDIETAMGALARGFGRGSVLARIRHRPPPALLRLLARRLASRPDMAARREAARDILAVLPAGGAPGELAANHTYWLTPCFVDDPDAARLAVMRRGYDATRGATSMRVIGNDPGVTPCAHWMMGHMLYLPTPGKIPAGKRQELGALIANHTVRRVAR